MREHRKQLLLVLLVMGVMASVCTVGCLPLEEHDGAVNILPPAEMKCTCTPCGSPCGASPPPPPPPPVPSTSNCPPPPPPPPYWPQPTVSLYPLDPNYYIGGASRCFGGWLPAFVVCGFLVLWEHWWV